MDAAAVYEMPARGRHLAVDERGIGLRATWRLDRGFVNLSLWRDDRCVETFHLTPVQAGRLVGFLVDGLAEAVPQSAPDRPVAAVPQLPRQPGSGGDRLVNLRRQLAEALDRAASRLRP